MASDVFVVPNWNADLNAIETITLENDACQATAASATCLARAIVPWGTDAIFNRFQCPVLIAELREVAAKAQDSEIGENLLDVAQFIEDRMTAVESLSYVLFLAD